MTMFNFRETETQKIFVTSDWHLNHNRDFVWKSRGYGSVQEHNDAMLTITNELVKEKDILFNLGDFCLNSSIDQFEGFIARLRCQNVYMLWGNHPNRHFKEIYKPMVQKILGMNYTLESEIYPLRYKNIVYLGHYAEVILDGQYAVLSHYPLYVFNEMAHGAWMLCGHSHNGCELSRAETTTGKILDVGWDGHGKPWSLEEIRAVMDTKQIVAVDHHHPDKTQIPNPQTKL